MLKVLIDTDPGTDDALALMMVLNSRDLDVLGVTTVGGNATLADTTRNVLRLMEHLDVQDTLDEHSPGIPVSRGAARPLQGKFHYGYYFHGPAGLGVRLPSPRTTSHHMRAPEFISKLADDNGSELVVLTLGPLTNIALALTLKPSLASSLRKIVVMGGAVNVPGNVTPHAEFNFYNDPRAAEIVLSSGVPITLIPLDVCRLVCFRREDKLWAAGRSKTAALANRIIRNWFKLHPEKDLYELCDPMAVAATIQPDILTYKQAGVRVEIVDRKRLGRSVAHKNEGQVNVAVKVDVRRSRALIDRLLASDVQ